jgi:hypothetical protein
MTPITDAQLAYDRMAPGDTFTMQFWGTVNGLDVSAFASVDEDTGTVDEITEVIYENVDVLPLLTDSQIEELVKQAQEFHDQKDDCDFHDEWSYE